MPCWLPPNPAILELKTSVRALHLVLLAGPFCMGGFIVDPARPTCLEEQTRAYTGALVSESSRFFRPVVRMHSRVNLLGSSSLQRDLVYQKHLHFLVGLLVPLAWL